MQPVTLSFRFEFALAAFWKNGIETTGTLSAAATSAPTGSTAATFTAATFFAMGAARAASTSCGSSVLEQRRVPRIQ
jgi:hypothetical protein